MTTVVTTGVISNSLTIGNGLITNFSSRFAGFDEYRIVKAKFVFQPFSSINPGVIRAWIEEKSATAPTVTLANTNRGITFPASSVERTHMLTWRPTDPTDTDYNTLSTSLASAYVKVYTDNTSYGSSIVATDYLSVTPYFTVQFRGLA